MRRTLLLTLVFFLAGSASLAGCKYQRPKDQETDAKVGEKGVLLDEQGQPLMPSSGEAGAVNAEVPVAKVKTPPPPPGKPTIPGKEPSAGPQPGDIPAPADVAAPPADAEKTATGLASKVLAKTSGKADDRPAADDTVKVDYTGWTTDGKMFDSSVKRGTPAEFPLNGVIPGWTEGLQLMAVGEKRRFWIPEELAYKGMPGRPAGMLVFDVELLEIKRPPAPSLPVAAAPADAEKTPTGILSKVIAPGTGAEKPTADDVVSVHYTGWTTDGKMFDSSVMRGEPAKFPLDKVIPGWSQGVQLMVLGEKRMMWIPEELAYKGQAGAPQGTLVFEIELLEIAKAPKAPADVAAPPADAEKTASGIASKVLQKGTGTTKPEPTATVEVHYSGWTTDGKMFDSSVARGQTAKFPLNGVIPGWTEGLQLMVEGEKRRLWIPEELAYKGRPGRPAGMLVFDVELIKIH